MLSGRSPAHGFCDDEQTRQLLRSRPPRQALAWTAARLGGRVVSARALRGGMSSAVHLITVQRSGAERDQAVLRRYVRPDPDEPDPAAREARALRLAEAADVPTPALLAVGPDGTEAGVPAAADVAHCRVNLLTMGAEVTERFTRMWERVADAEYHPWGDVVTIVGFLDDLRDDWGSERLLVEDTLTRAVTDLAG